MTFSARTCAAACFGLEHMARFVCFESEFVFMEEEEIWERTAVWIEKGPGYNEEGMDIGAHGRWVSGRKECLCVALGRARLDLTTKKVFMQESTRALGIMDVSDQWTGGSKAEGQSRNGPDANVAKRQRRRAMRAATRAVDEIPQSNNGLKNQL